MRGLQPPRVRLIFSQELFDHELTLVAVHLDLLQCVFKIITFIELEFVDIHIVTNVRRLSADIVDKAVKLIDFLLDFVCREFLTSTNVVEREAATQLVAGLCSEVDEASLPQPAGETGRLYRHACHCFQCLDIFFV